MTLFNTFYSGLWKLAKPLAARNHRLAQGLDQRTLQTTLPKADLWIQAASVGESKLALQLLDELKSELKKSRKAPTTILITTNTSQGYDLLQKELKIHNSKDSKVTATAAYFPFDDPAIMEKAVQAVSPKGAVLLETEIWPGFILALKEAGVPITVINGRMRTSSLTAYLTASKIFRPLAPDQVLAISARDAGRYRTLFPTAQVEEIPNIKFDAIGTAKPLARKDNPLGHLIAPRKQFVVLGSVRKEEEKDVVEIIADIKTACPKAIIGIFPRHMHRVEALQQKLNTAGIDTMLRSETPLPMPKEQDGQELEDCFVEDGSVLIWDTIGELMQGYALANAAFVGGSLAPLGGQNFLEPAGTGSVAVTGSSWSNFYWIENDFFETECAFKVQNSKEVSEKLIELTRKTPAKATIRKAFQEYVKTRKGGTETATQRIALMLKKG